MSKTIVKPRQNGTIKSTDEPSPVKNGKSHSYSPLKRLKACEDQMDGTGAKDAIDSDDAELARKLHEQLNGPDSPTAVPITRHASRVRKAPVFYKPEQFGGYQGYHGVDGGPEQEVGLGEVSPRHGKEHQLPRELRRLQEHSMSMSDSEAKSNHPAGPRRTRAYSVPDPSSDNPQAQQPIAAHSSDLGAQKRPDVKAEEDADTHSRSGSQRSRKQRSATPELRLTRSKHHSQDLPAELRQTGRSLPVKMDQSAVSGDKAAINQGSSGSPGKGTGSSSQQGLHKRHSSKVAVGDGGGVVKAEVTSSRLRHGTGGASTSGESHSHVDLAVACPDQADAVEGSGRRGSDRGAVGVSKRAKLPGKNPMVLQKQNGSYYRVRVLKEELHRVKIEFMGFEQQLQPCWLARDSERIWRGSYKNKAWKHLGDGAWEPRCGERGAPRVAHGTRQNQYTKRKALLNGASNTTSSNLDSDDNVGSSEDRDNRDQHGLSADTGFAAAEAPAPAGRMEEEAKVHVPAQNPAAASQGKPEESQTVGESGVLSRLQGADPKGARGRRHAKHNRDAEVGASMGGDAVPVSVPKAGRSGEPKAEASHKDGQADTAQPARSFAERSERSTKPGKDVDSNDGSARTDRHPWIVKSTVVVEAEVNNARDQALLSDDSGVKDDAQPSSADENAGIGINGVRATVQQTAKIGKAPKSSDASGKPAAVAQKNSKAAESRVPDNKTASAISSGSGQGSKGKAPAGPSGQQHRAGTGKAASSIEAALQCEEDLAEDAAASPGDIAAAVAAAKVDKSSDDKGKVAAEIEAPKVVVKPRRDRKGRIRGTYGINAKPVTVDTPADSPPAPGVTRASLRPKPAAKASPDDEEMEVARPAAGLRNARAASSGPEVGAVQESPNSPKGPATEVRRPNGRTAIQRRAAAANFAVAAAVAAEAADVIPSNHQHGSRPLSKSHIAHNRHGSNGLTRTGLDHIRSGRITKAMSGGSSGAGSSGGSMRFGSLMDALGEMESRGGGFYQQPHANRTLSLGAPPNGFGSHASLRPALFDRRGNGSVNRWHEQLGPISPRILTLSPDLFQVGPSTYAAAGWSAPSLCHSMIDAGMSIQPQFPLFKTAG